MRHYRRITLTAIGITFAAVALALLATAGFATRLSAAPLLPRRAAAQLSHHAATRTTRVSSLRMLSLYSHALGGKTGLAILLPQDYATTARRYPVLYLLAGHRATHWQWLTNGDTVPLVKPLPLIVVMPDAYAGWYANPVSGSGPRWEDYIINELIPYVDSNYRTIAARSGRAVAGLSMGGYGAFEFAALHPDLFASASSFSGNLDITLLQTPYWLNFFPTLTTVFGDPRTHELYWRGHNPVDLASNLRGVQLYLASGNGQPGPLDGSRRYSDPGEADAHMGLEEMSAALSCDGIPATVEYYGAGTHTWPYWKRDLHHAMPLIMGTFAHPPAPPMPWSYRTIADRFAVWGYRVVRSGGSAGWTELTNVSPQGLTADGSGTLTIITAPLYRPGALYRVGGDVTGREVRADRSGRLDLRLTLAGAATPRHLTIAAAS